jgi:hypothetical protein
MKKEKKKRINDSPSSLTNIFKFKREIVFKEQMIAHLLLQIFSSSKER